jgi:hypothetical protein
LRKNITWIAGSAIFLFVLAIWLYNVMGGPMTPADDPLQQTFFNMKAAQIAAESHARVHEGLFPTSLDSKTVLAAYAAFKGTKWPLQVQEDKILNGVTHRSDWLVNQPVDTQAKAVTVAQNMSPGQVAYCQLLDNTHRDYFILGKLSNGKFFTDLRGEPLILRHADFLEEQGSVR